MLTLFMSVQSHATHMMGVDHTGGFLTSGNLKITRVCYAGVGYQHTGPTNWAVNFYGCPTPSALTGWSPWQAASPFYSCGQVQRWESVRIFDMTGMSGCTWDIEITANALNPWMTSLANSTPPPFSVTLSHVDANGTNEPPVWNTHPVFCASTANTTVVDVSALDPEGDSLRYHLIGAPGANYNNGYSGQNSLGPDWTVALNQQTGLLTLTPNPGSIESTVFNVLVDEYRSGQWIGSATREFELVTTTSNLPLGITETVQKPQVSLTGNPLNANSKLQFELPVKMETQIEVVSLKGKVWGKIFEGELEAGRTKLGLEALNTLPAGVWLFRIRTGTENIVLKAVKL